MGIDLSVIGVERGPRELWWNSSHCLLYAVGVGCGAKQLSFVTENSSGVAQQVLPTFVCTVGEASRLFAEAPEQPAAVERSDQPLRDFGFGAIDPAKMLHAFERLELHAPLRTSARVHVWSTVTAIWDKGAGAVVETENRAHDASTGELLYTGVHGVFVRDAGGFGGERGPSGAAGLPPDRPPDEQITYPTSPDQTYIYRLAYGRHPLHSDPEFARRAGFDQPILTGMCTYGFTGRGLLDVLCGGDPARFRSMEGRFARPVVGGDSLTVKMWVDGSQARFVTEDQRGQQVISHGLCRFN